MMCFDVLIFLQLKDTTVSIGMVIGSETSAVFCEYVGKDKKIKIKDKEALFNVAYNVTDNISS